MQKIHAHEIYQQLLERALTEPGVISEAYRRFHRFSIGNQVWAAVQLAERGSPLSPIASYEGWKKVGRAVKKGEKALALLMPITIKRRMEQTAESEAGGNTFTWFRAANRWFSLDQTEGHAFSEPLETPEWDASLALKRLDVECEPFECMDGNVQGYAKLNRIAVSPLAVYPHKTRFHELAHVVLGHTKQAEWHDLPMLSRSVEEAEAESVAFILCSLLNLPGRAESRGYIQAWLEGQKLPEKSAQRIFGAANKILKAGKAIDGEEAGNE